MAQPFDCINDPLRHFIEAQQMFFVASAPLAGDGHVNLSPKGLDTFRVLSPTRVAYLDLTGSGNETAAHLAEPGNGRITFMFCSFRGKPVILRLWGHGRVVLPGDAAWEEFSTLFPALPGQRQIIVADIDRVMTSCGYGVPLMEFAGQRDTLPKWAAAKGEARLQAYREMNNAVSIDGLEAPRRR
jgi:hypothetical protein